MDLRGDGAPEIGRGQQRAAHASHPGMRVRGADEREVRHPFDADVVQKLGASCQNPRVLEPADWLSDSHSGEVT